MSENVRFFGGGCVSHATMRENVRLGCKDGRKCPVFLCRKSVQSEPQQADTSSSFRQARRRLQVAMVLAVRAQDQRTRSRILGLLESLGLVTGQQAERYARRLLPALEQWHAAIVWAEPGMPLVPMPRLEV
jgi:hypothetical protein